MSCSTMFFGNTKINNLTNHISINFTRSNISGGLIEPNELAGAIPAKNWNNITTDICNNFSSRKTPTFFMDFAPNSNIQDSTQNPNYKTIFIDALWPPEKIYQKRDDIYGQAIWGSQTHTIFFTRDYYYNSNAYVNNTDGGNINFQNFYDSEYNPEGVTDYPGPRWYWRFKSVNGNKGIFTIELYLENFELLFNLTLIDDDGVSRHYYFSKNGKFVNNSSFLNMLIRVKIDFNGTTPKIILSKLNLGTMGTGTDITLLDDFYTDWEHKEFYPSDLASYTNWYVYEFSMFDGYGRNRNAKFDYMVSTLPLDDTNLTGNITQNLISGIKPLKDSKGKLLVNTKLIQTPSSITTLNENYSKDYDTNAHDAYIINAPNNNKSINDYNNYTSNKTLFKGYTECYDRIDIIDIPEDFRNSTYDVRIYTSFDSNHGTNDMYYRLERWDEDEGNNRYNILVIDRVVGSVDNSFVYPVINQYKQYNNLGAIDNIAAPGVWDPITQAMSNNDPYVKTSISDSGFVGTELGWNAVSHYASGNTAYYSNNNYAIFKDLSSTYIRITNGSDNKVTKKIGGIQITKNN